MEWFRDADMTILKIQGAKAKMTTKNIIAEIDLNKIKDVGTPSKLKGSLGEFGGKIQQTWTGQLINSKYDLHIICIRSGCVFSDPNPRIIVPIEILAPEKIIAFQQEQYITE